MGALLADHGQLGRLGPVPGNARQAPADDLGQDRTRAKFDGLIVPGRFVHVPGDPEVNHANIVVAYQQVRWLHVAVHHPAGVERGEHLGQRPPDGHSRCIVAGLPISVVPHR